MCAPGQWPVWPTQPAKAGTLLQREAHMIQEEEFSISTERLDGCLIVSVRGELDELNAEPLN